MERGREKEEEEEEKKGSSLSVALQKDAFTVRGELVPVYIRRTEGVYSRGELKHFSQSLCTDLTPEYVAQVPCR